MVLNLFLFGLANSPSAIDLDVPSLPSSGIDNTQEKYSAASSERSARMFENAHNVRITGGEFYSAEGNISIGQLSPYSLSPSSQFNDSILIDASHGKDTSTHLTSNTTHLRHHQHVSNWQVSLPMPQSATIGEQIDCETQEIEHDSSDTKSCLSEDATAREAEATVTEPFDSVVGRQFEWNESELKEQRQVIQDVVVSFLR